MFERHLLPKSYTSWIFRLANMPYFTDEYFKLCGSGALQNATEAAKHLPFMERMMGALQLPKEAILPENRLIRCHHLHPGSNCIVNIFERYLYAVVKCMPVCSNFLSLKR